MTTHDRRDLLAPDYVLEWMKHQGIKVTRKSYLEIAFMGDPPKEPMDAELEADLPEEIRKRAWRKKR
jgi:hypothetical protein